MVRSRDERSERSGVVCAYERRYATGGFDNALVRRALVVGVVVVALAGVGLERAVFAGPAADLRSVPAIAADARADRIVSDEDLARYVPTIEQSANYVEGLFHRRFAVKPKVVLFATLDSFRDGVAALFDYSDGTAQLAATNYGGIFDRDTQTIAINLGGLGVDGLAPTLDHELTHYMLRQITGTRTLPTWVDEGIATTAQRFPAGSAHWPEQDALVGRAVAVSHRVSFQQTEALEAWHATYPFVGQALYSWAGEAITLMRARIEWDGVLKVVERFAAGGTFDDAYGAASGETLAALEARLADRESAIVTRPTSSGDVEWTLFTASPLTPTKVTIGGASTYTVTFTVETDDLGLYRGTFGSTAPPGKYAVSAAGARAQFATQRR